jgi:hypothetical protein
MEPPPGVVKHVSNVDLRSQIDTYLSERKRSPATVIAIRRTLHWYLDVTEQAGLPPDSKQAATLFKKWLQARGIGVRTLNGHLALAHPGLHDDLPEQSGQTQQVKQKQLTQVSTAALRGTAVDYLPEPNGF